MTSLNDSSSIENIESSITDQLDTSEKIICIQLHDGTWVDERFYNQVLQLICESVPALKLEEVNTTKMLCGKEFWDTLEKGDRIKAGKCVVDMVQKNLLLLRFAGTTKANSQLYKLK